jgi:hypothetical protein
VTVAVAVTEVVADSDVDAVKETDGDSVGVWVGGGVTVDERLRLVEKVLVTESVAEGVTVGGGVIVAVAVIDALPESEFDTVRETV